MSLVIIKNKEVLSMDVLIRLILRHIYDNDLSAAEMYQVRDSMVKWKNHVDLCRETGKDYEENEYRLQRMALLLKRNEEGEFEHRKQLFKRCKVDWRKFHRLPEAYLSRDFIEGQKALHEAMKAHPEDYRKN